MIPGWLLLLVSLGYVGLLFAVAYAGDQRDPTARLRWLRPLVYSLTLAVYCSSWTYYGAVGTAARTGLGFVPIYLGPLLLLLFGWRILERLVLISGEHRIVSIADFLSSRYGRAPGLAALVAAVALTAAVPYVALQFKAVAMSVSVLAPGSEDALPGDPALYVALLLAAFAILFGTRQIDATEHHRGMMLAVALESLVKLVAFVSIGVLALLHLPGSGGAGERAVQAAGVVVARGMPDGFLAQSLLAFAAIVCLPRQFHVAVVECQDPADLRPARWLFGAYLVLFSLMVVPISLAGQALLAGSGASPDTFVLALPMALGHDVLALATYVGGFSAATGMVIVASVALATMVSNDLVMPLLLRSGALHEGASIDRQVLWVRRVTIVALALMAYAYHHGTAGETLAQYGLLAFAAVAQFAPALIGGLYWRGASRAGAFSGLLAGASLWAYTLLLPALARGGWFATGWIDSGLLGLHWLRPEQLFGLRGWDPLTHGVFWSLLCNVGAFLLMSSWKRPRLQDQLLATSYLDPYAQRSPLGPGSWAGSVRGGELLALAERIVGERPARRAFDEYAQSRGRPWQPEQPADRGLVQFTERLLASAIGAASARLTLTTALRGSGMELGEVVSLLDEASQELRFNREVLSTTMENISQGVSVVDADLRLVAWNRRYQELFGYPDGMLYVGRPVSDLIRWNAQRGEMGGGDIQEQVRRRIAHLRAGAPHLFERVRASGQVIEMRGQALPGGGYVTTYSDVTDYKRAERELREVNETLEQRVEQRTREAEAAQQSKARFLAAVSHDVLQPLNAARLFASALRESRVDSEQSHLAERVDTSLRAAEELLDGLLDISRLDAGALQPQVGDFDAGELLRELVTQYAPTAADRGLRLRVRLSREPLPLHSDRRLLRRALQNFLANALRYTRSGGVLLAARARGDTVALQVWDTGPGIAAHHLDQIFDEFRRFEQPDGSDERGLGLGLSICQRIARTLDHPLTVRSRVGHGSMFAITVPLGRTQAPAPAAETRGESMADALTGLRVLCVDNDREILDGMGALLGRWRVEVLPATDVEEALALVAARPEVLLVDYHLHDRLDGLALIAELRARAGRPLPAALLTGDGSDALKHAARERGCVVLTKPIKPASLRALLASTRTAGAGDPRPADEAAG
ncbi:PAS domain-containing hybrid sensor histidine kinase/response regulator [Cognatiluteimonas weifangensis]|uniref:histidine kinase n=1 Tax=Cognatiluteimonas weifangensis TaxID=2303539 RepID=A0A372DHH4_9GAMM|nr:PAS domain-containing hybrid sensor histidine kinase/response regulator [Luteimonas weifangensis]RFP58957.1 response regulator [Luteimonas weifangensis]